jgi:hypothetical protein
MHLTGPGTAVPPQRFMQAECWAALQVAPQFPQLNARSHALLTKVLLGGRALGVVLARDVRADAMTA